MISLNGTVHDFSVDHSSTKKGDILNTDQCLMVKNYKTMFRFTKKPITELLTSINASNHTKCVSLSNQQWTTQTSLIKLRLNEYTQRLPYVFQTKKKF